MKEKNGIELNKLSQHINMHTVLDRVRLMSLFIFSAIFTSILTKENYFQATTFNVVFFFLQQMRS